VHGELRGIDDCGGCGFDCVVRPVLAVVVAVLAEVELAECPLDLGE